MGWGYKVCSACKYNQSGYACDECYNGDLFSYEYEAKDEYEYSFKISARTKKEENYITKLKERDSSKKVKITNSNGYDKYYCPTCNKYLDITNIDTCMNTLNEFKDYCLECGSEVINLKEYLEGD